MLPNSRQTLKDYCLRRLGFPVIQLNLDDDQLEDRIDEAIHLWQSYHYDGTRPVLGKHQVTQTDIDNMYFTVPSNVVAVSRVFPLPAQATSISGQFNMFDITYQIRLNELYDFTSADYVYFELAQQHLRTLEMLFIGDQQFRYNKYNGNVYIDMSWSTKVVVGNWIVYECRIILDEDLDNFWSDNWLRDYTTCLFKEQWGTNISKFVGVQLPGGIVLNGDKIYNDAIEEKQRLEEKLRDTYEEPVIWQIG